MFWTKRDYAVQVRTLTVVETQSSAALMSLLADRSSLFRQLADTIPIMIAQMDSSGQHIFWNAACYDYAGLPHDIGANDPEAWASFIHPEDLAVLMAAKRKAIPAREGYAVELRLRPLTNNDAPYCWFISRATPQYVDDIFQGWLITIVDIDEQHERAHRERQLREESAKRENEFKALGEAIPEILWTATADGTIDWYNHHWYDYTGLTAEESAGWGWQSAHHPEDLPEVMRIWPAAIAAGQPCQLEFRLKDGAGRFRWFLTRIHPYRDAEGNVIRWFGTNTDIHDQKITADKTKRVAQTLQEVFLPEHLPQLPNVRFDALYEPAGQDALIGGDWYDAFELSNGGVVISIGDVAGHGLEAAVIAGRLRQTIFAQALENPDPASVLAKADRVLRAQTDTIATALVALFDPLSGELIYASAGHPMPIVAGIKTTPKFLQGNHAALGTGFIPSAFSSELYRVTIGIDEVVILYTDGLTEYNRDLIGGEAALLDAVADIIKTEPLEPAAALFKAILRGNIPKDDSAVLWMRRCRPSLAFKKPQSSLTKTWRFHSSHAHSAVFARRELMGFIEEHALAGSDLFIPELIIGELLANSVEHAPGLVEIHIDWTSAYPHLRMRDSGPGIAQSRKDTPGLPHDALDENGRGLFLISTLSQSMQIQPAPGYGTEISLELPVQR